MAARDEARAHLGTARELLDAAALDLEAGQHAATVSSCVLAGIKAKDAICLWQAGHSGPSDDADVAVPELAAAGRAGKAAASPFRRLLALETTAGASPISPTVAVDAVAWATYLVETAGYLIRT